jgi:hypothetical protein
MSTQTTITKKIAATSTSTSSRPVYTTITVEKSSFALYIIEGVSDGYYLSSLDKNGLATINFRYHKEK